MEVEPKVTALHPKLADAVPQIITEAKARGLVVAMFSGVRKPEEQEKLYALGRTVKNPDGFDPVKKPLGNIITNAKTWESWHFYGLAVDLAFKNSNGGWWWPKDEDDRWDEIGKIGGMFGLAWGGAWTKFPDLPHFQLTGKIPTVREAKRILFEKGIEAVWALV